MKLTVKTLKGEKFQVDAEPSNTVGQVKGIVETAKSEMSAEGMKLIHSGKILKDDDTIESCNIKPTDFLVVMVSKKKAPAPAPAAAAAAPAPAAPETPAPAAAAAAASTSTTTTPAETPATTTTSSAAAAAAPPAPARPADNFSDETVATLTALGFPETEVRHCLRAANGNPDIAVEFLTNGIPPGIPQPGTAASPATRGSGGGQPLQALREHPQFDALRRLVQSNPQMLQQVLTQIGQQQPELLQEINANQALFLQMMNEPVADASSSSSSPAAPTGGTSSSSGMSSMMEGMANPQQLAAMLQNMNPQELQQMATMMGFTPEQLQATARMIGQIPPDQLQEYMMQAMQQGGGMMPPGMMGGGGGPQVLRLNEEEMAAVDRLTEMGFDRAEAAQAFLACDKNEALAANLLMDSAGQEGGVFGFQDDNNNDNNDGSGGGGNDNDGDDMYD